MPLSRTEVGIPAAIQSRVLEPKSKTAAIKYFETSGCQVSCSSMHKLLRVGDEEMKS